MASVFYPSDTFIYNRQVSGSVLSEFYFNAPPYAVFVFLASGSEATSGSTYSTTASYALSSSYSITSSYAIYASTSSYLLGSNPVAGYYSFWDLNNQLSTGSLYQISASIIEISSDIIPSQDNTFSIGSLLKRWSNAFITTISASYAYISRIYGGSSAGDSLTLQGSSAGSGSVLINPNGDPVAIGTNLTRSGSVTVGGTLYGYGSAFFAGGNILVGSKMLPSISTSYVDALTLDIPANESVYVKFSLHGRWSDNSPSGFVSECFLQKGDDNAYTQPGVILNQYNNNINGQYISSQILDSSLTASNAIIKIQLQTTNNFIPTSKILYEVRGNFNNLV